MNGMKGKERMSGRCFIIQIGDGCGDGGGGILTFRSS